MSVPGGGLLHGLTDGDAQRAGRVGVLSRIFRPALVWLLGLGMQVAPQARIIRSSIGLLVVGDLDHIDLALDAEEVAGQGQGAAPLPGPGLGGDALAPPPPCCTRPGQWTVLGLWLPARAHPLPLVVDLRRGPQGLFPASGSDERGRTPDLVDVQDLIGDLDVPLLAHLLGDEAHGEEGGQVVGADGLVGARMNHRRHGHGEVGLDVVPVPRHLSLVRERSSLSPWCLLVLHWMEGGWSMGCLVHDSVIHRRKTLVPGRSGWLCPPLFQ